MKFKNKFLGLVPLFMIMAAGVQVSKAAGSHPTGSLAKDKGHPYLTVTQDDIANISAKIEKVPQAFDALSIFCLLYTSPSPRDQRGSRMPSSA